MVSEAVCEVALSALVEPSLTQACVSLYILVARGVCLLATATRTQHNPPSGWHEPPTLNVILFLAGLIPLVQNGAPVQKQSFVYVTSLSTLIVTSRRDGYWSAVRRYASPPTAGPPPPLTRRRSDEQLTLALKDK